MKRIKLVVAYDGTNYCGWQYQPNVETIEGVLNEKLSALLNEHIEVIGASRTDAGVHALGNVAVFDTETTIPSDKIYCALNTKLPDEIRAVSSCEVADDFHPRHCDTVKTYEYRIYNARVDNPVKRFYFHTVHQKMDVGRMNEAAKYFIGEHDFKSFCAAGAQVQTTVRTIYSLEVEKNGSDFLIRVTGNGFLYNMVRIIAGTLIKVGTGLIEPDSITAMIEAKDRCAAGPTAPAKGLMLAEIKYL